jgi:hypothetical protein
MQFVLYDADSSVQQPIIQSSDNKNVQELLDVDRIEAKLRLDYQRAIQLQFQQRYNEAIQLYKQILSNNIFALAEKQLVENKSHHHNHTLVSRSVYYLQSLIYKNLGEIYQTQENYAESAQSYAQSIAITYISNENLSKESLHITNLDLKLFHNCAIAATKLHNAQLARYCYEFVLNAVSKHNSAQLSSYFQLNFNFLDNYIDLLYSIGDQRELLNMVKTALKINKIYHKGYILLSKILLQQWNDQKLSQPQNFMEFSIENLFAPIVKPQLQQQVETLQQHGAFIRQDTRESIENHLNSLKTSWNSAYFAAIPQENDRKSLRRAFPYKIGGDEKSAAANTGSLISLPNIAQSLINLYSEIMGEEAIAAANIQNKSKNSAGNQSRSLKPVKSGITKPNKSADKATASLMAEFLRAKKDFAQQNAENDVDEEENEENFEEGEEVSPPAVGSDGAGERQPQSSGIEREEEVKTIGMDWSEAHQEALLSLALPLTFELPSTGQVATKSSDIPIPAVHLSEDNPVADRNSSLEEGKAINMANFSLQPENCLVPTIESTVCEHKINEEYQRNKLVCEESNTPSAELSAAQKELQQKRRSGLNFLKLGVSAEISIDSTYFEFSSFDLFQGSAQNSLQTSASPAATQDSTQVALSFLENRCQPDQNRGILHVIHEFLRYLRVNNYGLDYFSSGNMLFSLVSILFNHNYYNFSGELQELLYFAEISLDFYREQRQRSPSHAKKHQIKRALAIKNALVAEIQLELLENSKVQALQGQISEFPPLSAFSALFLRLFWLESHSSWILSPVDTAISSLKQCAALISCQLRSENFNFQLKLAHCTSENVISLTNIANCLDRLQGNAVISSAQHEFTQNNYEKVISLLSPLLFTDDSSEFRKFLALENTEKYKIAQIMRSSAHKTGQTQLFLQILLVEFTVLAREALFAMKNKQKLQKIKQSIANLIEKITKTIEKHRNGAESSQFPFNSAAFLQFQSNLAISLALAMRKPLNSTCLYSVCSVYMKFSLRSSKITQKSEVPSLKHSNFRQEIAFRSEFHEILASCGQCNGPEGREFLLNYLERLFEGVRVKFSTEEQLAQLMLRSKPLPAELYNQNFRQDFTGINGQNNNDSNNVELGPIELGCDAELYDQLLSQVGHCFHCLFDLFKLSTAGAHSLELNQIQPVDGAILRSRIFNYIISLLLFRCSRQFGKAWEPSEDLRNDILSAFELLCRSIYFSELNSSENNRSKNVIAAPPAQSAFIEAFLSEKSPLLSLYSSFQQIPSVSIKYTARWKADFYRFYSYFVLPAYVGRALGADDWYSSSSYRAEWDSEQTFLTRLFKHSLLTEPQDYNLWFALGLLNWELSNREFFTSYQDLYLDPFKSLANSLKSHQIEQINIVNVWLNPFNKALRCFLFCLFKLKFVFQHPEEQTDLLATLFPSISPQNSPNSASASAPPHPTLHNSRPLSPEQLQGEPGARGLVLLLWQQLGYMFYRLSQLLNYLPFLSASINSNGNELTLSSQCFHIALSLSPHHWTAIFMQAKCAKKSGAAPAHYLQLFSTATLLAMQLFERNRSNFSPKRQFSHENGEEIGPNKRKFSGGRAEHQIKRSRSEETQQNCDSRDAGEEKLSEEGEEEIPEKPYHIFPLYSLHSNRLKLLLLAEESLKQRDKPEDKTADASTAMTSDLTPLEIV